jgi:hypothetical protein
MSNAASIRVEIDQAPEPIVLRLEQPGRVAKRSGPLFRNHGFDIRKVEPFRGAADTRA